MVAALLAGAGLEVCARFHVLHHWGWLRGCHRSLRGNCWLQLVKSGLTLLFGKQAFASNCEPGRVPQLVLQHGELAEILYSLGHKRLKRPQGQSSALEAVERSLQARIDDVGTSNLNQTYSHFFSFGLFLRYMHIQVIYCFLVLQGLNRSEVVIIVSAVSLRGVCSMGRSNLDANVFDFGNVGLLQLRLGTTARGFNYFYGRPAKNRSLLCKRQKRI